MEKGEITFFSEDQNDYGFQKILHYHHLFLKLLQRKIAAMVKFTIADDVTYYTLKLLAPHFFLTLYCRYTLVLFSFLQERSFQDLYCA